MNKIDFYGKIVKVERSDIMNTFIPKNYKSKLSIYETQTSIGIFKRIFEERLCKYLNLKRVSAPLFVKSKSGLNDDLNGIERPVSFTTKSDPNELQIVHSLAKWKRLALHEYEFGYGEGLYTDMNAIRRDEDMDNIMSNLHIEVQKKKKKDYVIFSLFVIGFDVTTISHLLNTTMNTIYIRKSRIRHQIEELNPLHKQQFLEVLDQFQPFQS